jgi:hypothetical protein
MLDIQLAPGIIIPRPQKLIVGPYEVGIYNGARRYWRRDLSGRAWAITYRPEYWIFKYIVLENSYFPAKHMTLKAAKERLDNFLEDYVRCVFVSKERFQKLQLLA